MADDLMIQADLDFHYTFVDIWKTFVVVGKWKMSDVLRNDKL